MVLRMAARAAMFFLRQSFLRRRNQTLRGCAQFAEKK